MALASFVMTGPRYRPRQSWFGNLPRQDQPSEIILEARVEDWSQMFESPTRDDRIRLFDNLFEPRDYYFFFSSMPAWPDDHATISVFQS